MTNFEGLKENERIDDLQINGLKIIQNTQKFCFGIDAVLLANYVMEESIKNKSILDLGTGTGIIPLILWGKSEPKEITALEIQRDMVEMARRSMKLNHLEDKIKVQWGDIKDPPKDILPNDYDILVSNPPYMENKRALVNPEESKAIARHEVLCTLEDLIRTAKRTLKPKGKFYMVHRAQRLVDILYLLRKWDMEPKKLRFIHPNKNKAPNLVLVQAIKGSKPNLIIEKPLYVYKENGNYTEEIYDIYSWEKGKYDKERE